MQKIINDCKEWIKNQVESAGASGVILGLSGGIDSAVVSVLARQALGHNGTFGIIMPCHSIKKDEEDAKLTAEKFDVPYKIIDLSEIFDGILKLIGDVPILAQSNLKARLRMSVLYSVAQAKNFLVCGTSNRSEFYTGYFTKYGDAGVDLMPLANFLKREVREVAKILGLPDEIINKAPSAGLYEGQTDESDMGFTYEILDEYLTSGKINNSQARDRIEAMHAKSEHKRKQIPIFKF